MIIVYPWNRDNNIAFLLFRYLLLHYAVIHFFVISGFKDRWFRLKYNLLFYYNINEADNINDVNPSGIIILENCNINSDTVPGKCFSFSIVFQNDLQKRHIMCAQSESQITLWTSAVKQASYEYWRSQLIFLRSVLCKKTGEDPLLMYPRNEGIIRNRPRETKKTFLSHIDSSSWTTSSATDDNGRTHVDTNLIRFD